MNYLFTSESVSEGHPDKVADQISDAILDEFLRHLSAGRVQSAALKIVVDKEREIKAFKPVEYYSIDAIFKKKLEAELVKFDGQKMEKLSVNSLKFADEIVASVKNEKFSVSNIESKERKTNPYAPFMTSTLQQSASSSLGFSPKKTMSLAQSLYEGVNTKHGGAITYMRTDSLNIAKEAIAMARDFIKSEFGDKYLPKTPNFYTTSSKGAQEAHEAIRPTDLKFTPELAAATLPKDEARLYTLIYNRFVASQMTPSVSQIQTINIKGEKSEFRLSGRKVSFDGFYRIYGDLDKDKILPVLNIGDEMQIEKISSEQHFTEPPARYSEASLVKKLESLGIGRPSTYAPTISLLSARKYVQIEKKQLIPTEIAFKITEMLEKNFENIVDSEFTSKMEEKLDDIAENKADWQEILSEFYYPFIEKISEGKTNIASQKVAVSIGEACPECGGDLLKRSGRYGEFIACSNFPKCKYSRNLGSNDETSQATAKKVAKEIGVKCPECGGEIVERFSRRGKFYGCKNYPKCKFVSNYEPTNLKCPECKKTNLVKKVLKSGTFFECLECKFKEKQD